MTIALTRAVPDSIAQCELTHLARESIDVGRARAEHAAYEDALRSLDIEVVRMPSTPDHPDSVFVEDTAVVLDEIAIMTRPGAASRRGELKSVEETLGEYRALARITAPATMDGGDVLVLDREIVVGLSGRTNANAVEQLRRLVRPYGYSVRGVTVRGSLHLKSAITRIAERTLLVNPRWVSPHAFTGWDSVPVADDEAFGANALFVDVAVIYADAFPNTRKRLEDLGCRVVPVPAGELAKAEGGVTCCSLLVRRADAPR